MRLPAPRRLHTGRPGVQTHVLVSRRVLVRRYVGTRPSGGLLHERSCLTAHLSICGTAGSACGGGGSDWWQRCSSMMCSSTGGGGGACLQTASFLAGFARAATSSRAALCARVCAASAATPLAHLRRWQRHRPRCSSSLRPGRTRWPCRAVHCSAGVRGSGGAVAGSGANQSYNEKGRSRTRAYEHGHAAACAGRGWWCACVLAVCCCCCHCCYAAWVCGRRITVSTVSTCGRLFTRSRRHLASSSPAGCAITRLAGTHGAICRQACGLRAGGCVCMRHLSSSADSEADAMADVQ